VKLPRNETIRVFLVNWLFTSLYGLTFGEWARLLWKHRFAVDPPCWPRAAFMTATSLVNSALAAYEDRAYGAKVASARIAPPLFILGHWRSGTTLLHHLLAVDTRFAYPSLWQVLNPHTFLSTDRYAGVVRFAAPRTRMMDNLGLDAAAPFEDEFATCGTLRSPFLCWVFPRQEDYYLRYLTFREVPAAELAEWKAALITFYKKLSWKYARPLLLKSPPHTARVKLLLDMFPGARFVHISRDPYTVFQSTRRQVATSIRTTRLQYLPAQNADALIIRRYKTMYDAYFEERALIPQGQLHEIRFEDLERDPVGQVGRMYETLDLPDFAAVQPSLQRYVASLATYRKNKYAELPAPLRQTLARDWRRSFEAWGYAT
jgi:hypothetical protein